MLLTSEERAKFVQYLELDAYSNDQVATQMEKMKSPPTDMLAKRLRQEAAAAKIVAAKLKATEDMSVSK